MSVADIFKLQTQYNLHDKFNDQTNWQDAFKIADSFNQSASLGAKAKEDWRKYYENRDAHQTRVDAMNAVNRYTQNNAQWQTQFNDQTMPNKIGYTNWDYGHKTRVGDFEWQQSQEKALREKEQRISDAEFAKWYRDTFPTGALPTPEELAKHAQTLSPEHWLKLRQMMYPAKPQELSWQAKQDYEHKLRRQNEIDGKIAQYIKDYGDISSPEGAKYIESLGYAYPELREYLLGRYGIQQNANGSPTAPSSPTILVEGVTKGVPMGANTASVADVRVPYAYGVTPTAPTATTPVQPAPAPIDYRSIYNLSDTDLALANELRAATGLSEQDTLRSLNGYFLARKQGAWSPEKTEEMIRNEIAKANRHRVLAAQIPEVVNPNRTISLTGNTVPQSQPVFLFNGIKTY